MKTTNQFFSALVIALLLFSTTSITAQDDVNRPEYITVTTMYWNKDYDGTMAEWKAMEKEYRDKVTSKNEHVMSANYYTHLLTPNSNEVLAVSVYPTWDDIDKASSRSAELEKEAWPDTEARKAFLTKLSSAFANYHSDEIYATLPGAKQLAEAPTKDMVLYVRTNKMAYPDNGSQKEFDELNKKYLDNVVYKNEYIKGYWPNAHAWGHDKRDYIEAFMIDSLGDLEKLFDRNTELMNEALTKDEAKAMGKYFGKHGDAVYTYVHL